ncbi:MAG: aldehyde dehydrogenase family protein [Gemmatimonadales bacterium]|nr:aldehyde dehydrogenase family protein [Gemmatimonadales bacterium]
MDKDLASVQEARDLVERAHAAQQAFAHATQEETDRVVEAMARAASASAEPLARLAVDETGMGRYEDKVLKNKFGADDVLKYIRPLKTVGVIREIPELKVKEMAVPMGVVAALIPTTNPTSTAIYKALISVKGRNAIVMSPHPRAVKCINEAARIMHDAAVGAGAPKDLVLSMTIPTLEGTQELMRQKRTAMILATGGYPMVRAAYSSGKPAYGVGPGNVPAIIERTADVPKAVRDIVNGKCFDHGLLCSAENSIVCDAPVDAEVRAELPKNGAVFVTGDDRARLQRAMQDSRTGGVSAEIVGLAATVIAGRAGITVPADTRVLVVECTEVGPKEFFSREKLSPVLGYYVEDGWERCCERSIQLLEFGGLGHSLAIHSRDEPVIQRFFEEKPAFRILVNTMAAMGAVGYTTGLVPAMTLGPGTWAGSSTSDNIGPLHLINIKRLAYEIREYKAPGEWGAGSGTVGVIQDVGAPERNRSPLPAPSSFTPAEVHVMVDDFLAKHRASRGRG